MYLWTGKSPLHFGSHPDLDSRYGLRIQTVFALALGLHSLSALISVFSPLLHLVNINTMATSSFLYITGLVFVDKNPTADNADKHNEK